MSSIMRCRSGLMALSVMRDAPVLMEVAIHSSQDRTPRRAIVLAVPSAAARYRASGLVLWRKAAAPVRPDSALRSRRQLCTRVSSDHLWRLSKGAQEGAAHAVAIGKTRLPGDGVDRMAALLHHQAGGLDAKGLDRLCRRLAGSGGGAHAEMTGG